MSPKILIVVGTRPNFIKVTQFRNVNLELGNPFDIKIVHTGQHYDDKMADVFFKQFELTPDYFLNIPAESANTQMAEIMIRLEKVILEFKPSLIMVVGDVNSTFAAALTANKMNVKIAHIESGLRSNDRTMPEEINRVLTDEITDYFFVTEQSGIDNLQEEKKRGEIFFVGNTMIDTIVAFEDKIQANKIVSELKTAPNQFVLMTMHRPATVDNKEGLEKLIGIINFITRTHHLIFPIHPRTTSKLEQFNLKKEIEGNDKLILSDPLDYFSFQKLIADCAFVITDSGGIQEETTFRRKPCLTLRPNTERPSTITIGTNMLVPFETEKIHALIGQILDGTYKQGKVPPLWDGQATNRILESCMAIFSTDLERNSAYKI